jgi:hypothetical protein
LEKEKLHIVLKKVLSSKRFAQKKESVLLDYLVQATLTGKIPKETTIALEVFRKDDRFDPAEDSIVRSSVFALRKKLDEYYLDEGREDLDRIRIPKGAYGVELYQPPAAKQWKRRIGKIIPWLLLGVMFVVSAILFFGNGYFRGMDERSRVSYSDHVVWKSFLDTGKPVMIVLGDYYLIEKGNSDLTYSYLRHPQINSDEQLREASTLSRLPDDWKEGYGHSFLGQEIPIVALRVFQVFRNNSTLLSVKLSSELTAMDIGSHHIIYVGGYHSLGILKHFFTFSHYSIPDTTSTIIYRGHTPEEYSRKEVNVLNDFGIDKDYVLVSKMKGSSETDILFILSERAFGKTEIIGELTEPDFSLLPENDIRSEYWEILYRVKGLESSGFSHKRLYFDYLD